MTRGILTALLISVCTCFTPEESARLIVDVIQHFHTHAMYITTSEADRYDLRRNFQILTTFNYLSTTAVTTGVIFENQLTSNLELLLKYFTEQPLFVIRGLKPLSKLQMEHFMNEAGWIWAARTLWPVEKTLWMMMMDDSDIDNFFENIHVPFNIQLYVAQRSSKHETVVDISEVYRVAKDFPLEVGRVGSWDSTKDRISWTSAALYDRRTDLRGAVIKGGTMQNYPYTIVKYNKGQTSVHGSVGILWNILEQKLNFSTKYYTNYSSEYKLMNDAVTDRIDVVVYYLGVLGLAKLISPLTNSRLKLYMGRPEYEDPDWSIVLKPLDYKMWISYLSVIVLLAITLATFSYWNHKYGNRASEDHLYYSIASSIFYSLGIGTLQGQDRPPKLIASRIMYWTVYCVAVVTMAAYSAKIIANLSVKQHVMPFNDLLDLYRHSRHTIGVVARSHESFIKRILNRQNGKKNDIVFGKLKKANRFVDVKTIEEGLDRTCSSPFVFLSQEYKVTALAENLSCHIVPLAGYDEVIPTGFLGRSNFPYSGLLHYQIRKLHRSGVLKKLFDIKPHSAEPEMEQLPVVTMKHVRPTFLVLGVALFTSVAGVCCEVYRNRRRLRKMIPL